MKGTSMRRHFHRLFLLLPLMVGVITPTAPLVAAPLHQEPQSLTLTPIGAFATGIFDEGASEIVAFDAASQRLFSVNAAATSVDILDLANPTAPTLITSIDASALGGS